MRRRNLIVLLGAAALASPHGGRAQEPGRVYRLGILSTGPEKNDFFAAFVDELRQSGFVEGQNLQLVRLPSAAGSEIASAVATARLDAIFAAGEQLVRAAQQATQTVAILAAADDLELSGLVRSLAKPGSNTTGISILATELDAKRQDLLTELVPAARHIAALADPAVTGRNNCKP